MKKILFIVALIFVFSVFCFNHVKAESDKVTIKFFWAEGCPHCAHEKEFLNQYLSQNMDVALEAYEITKNRENMQLLAKIGHELGADVSGVPFTVIGNEYISGYLNGETDKKIAELIDKQKQNMRVTEKEGDSNGEEKTIENNRPSKIIKLPLLGEIDAKDYSLSVLSIIIGFIDGFNPCAMWTLLFLISILLGMKDRKRMWILGLAFIISSALVYLLFMSAWLNLFLFIGFVVTVRIIIALIAIGGGTYNIRDFFVNKEAGCKVSNSKRQQKVFEKIKKILHEKSFWVAFAGIVLLAFAVNLVELICSAGLPAVFTQILALSDLPKWRYYLYILLYILFFMLDDIFVFIVAMVTLKLTGVTTKYSRLSKLIGGSILFIIGVILLFKPEWLMFG